SLVVALGLGCRFYLEYLQLLLVPRLASVLIIVIILMVLISLLSHKLGLERGLSVALFPMVILTMTVERMALLWEEHGAAEALKQGIGS
ncbi:MAG: 7TM domain-containing protein, partial [Methylohalobius sp.]